jgi:predicted RND superfamily exporter protein
MFVGYILISSVLLGATVDYAILFSNKYLANRKTSEKKDAIIKTIQSSGEPISLSALVLTSAGVILALATDNEMIGQLGFLLARGTILAYVLVMIFLTAALYYFDRLIKKLSINYEMK